MPDDDKTPAPSPESIQTAVRETFSAIMRERFPDHLYFLLLHDEPDVAPNQMAVATIVTNIDGAEGIIATLCETAARLSSQLAVEAARVATLTALGS